MATGSWSGGGTGGNGGGDDRRPPGRWHPDDKIGFIFMQPRANLSGGKHFVPANWIYRLLLQAVAHAETVGRAQQLMQAVHDLVGGDAPLELSSHNYTKSTPSTVPFTSLTSQRETGFVQVMSNLIDRMREWSANIFPNDVASSNDGGGRRIDMPDAIDGPTALRLGTAAFALIQFFNLWCGPDAIEIPMEGGNATVTWIQLREVIRTAITTLTLRANFGLGNFSPNHKFL
jgi:hypothetical protein